MGARVAVDISGRPNVGREIGTDGHEGLGSARRRQVCMERRGVWGEGSGTPSHPWESGSFERTPPTPLEKYLTGFEGIWRDLTGFEAIGAGTLLRGWGDHSPPPPHIAVGGRKNGGGQGGRDPPPTTDLEFGHLPI